MLDIGAAALARLRASHTAPVLLRITDLGGVPHIVPVTAGSVTADASRLVRRAVSLEVADGAGLFDPADTSSVLSPFAGATVEVFQGISSRMVRTASAFTAAFGPAFSHTTVVYGDDETDWFPVGVFTVTEASEKSGPGGKSVSLTGEDVSTRINRPWSAEWPIAAGTTVSAAIRAILTDAGVASSAMSITVPSSFVTPSLILGGSSNGSPVQSCADLAEACGYTFSVSASGIFETRQMPSPWNDPQMDATGLLLSIDRKIALKDAVNGVVVQAEGTGMLEPWRAEKWIDDAESPLRRGGPYGENPLLVSTSMVSSVAQAEQAAELLFGGSVGFTFDVETVPMPHVDIGDVLSFTHGGRAFTTVVESFSLPLDAGSAQRLTVRAVTYGD